MNDRLIARARAADEEARNHKRLERAHRHKARAARERQAEIERQCARLGITVIYDQVIHPTGEGTFHGQDKTDPRPQHAD
ncbi:hypothetical protein [Nitratireductor soli]|uniref:hypothetical protein n=1 Tax=Nitratireductor soli TaxID=1670619 RepID=UPI00138EF4D3|nr:hypothetical protein [Nitratireductor soli]